MQSERKALTEGLLFGSDAGFSFEMKGLTRDAGVSHLVAASGANLRFVSSLWNSIFHLFGERFVQYSSVIAILAYWQLAEQSGSLWRASGMWTITWLGKMIGRKIPLWYSLAYTCILTAAGWKEFFTPGFWLSVLAILGVYFSQKLLSGEKKRGLFPQARFYSNKVALSLVEGTIIFGMVSLWLWPQYKVFQPIGILATWVLGMWVDPMVWLGVAEHGLSLLSFPIEIGLLQTMGLTQDLLFVSFLATLRALAQDTTYIQPAFILCGAGALTFLVFRQIYRKRLRTQRWKRLHV